VTYGHLSQPPSLGPQKAGGNVTLNRKLTMNKNGSKATQSIQHNVSVDHPFIKHASVAAGRGATDLSLSPDFAKGQRGAIDFAELTDGEKSN